MVHSQFSYCSVFLFCQCCFGCFSAVGNHQYFIQLGKADHFAHMGGEIAEYHFALLLVGHLEPGN